MFCLKSFKNSIGAIFSFIMVASFMACNLTNTYEPDPEVESVPADEFPSWSPDGKYITFNHFNPNADENTSSRGLYVLNLETNERTLVIEGLALSPDWSPNGEWITFNSGDIFKIRPDGSGLKRLTGQGMSFNPRWSPDGNTISYGRSGGQDVVGLWFFHLPDSTYKRFGYGGSPANWSPDGDKILFRSLDQFENPVSANSQLWVADTANTARTQLTTNKYHNRRPSWSPDGNWITWPTDKGGGSSGLNMIRADGSGQTELLAIELTKIINLRVSPSWSPDSKRIVFSNLNPDESKIVLWVINRDGSGLEQLTF